MRSAGLSFTGRRRRIRKMLVKKKGEKAQQRSEKEDQKEEKNLIDSEI